MTNRRVNVRRDLNLLFLPYYDALCACLISPVEIDGISYSWEPYCGVRSFMAQDRVYEQGRENINGIWVVREPSKVVTNAKGGESPHNYRCATDWCLWDADGEPLWPEKEDPVWKLFIDAVTAVHLRPGSEFGDVDHCELRINVSWKTIGDVWHEHGPHAADAAIKIAIGPAP